ncbi:WecB/TagA/CpsF family glycosyltransferase [Phenylobacterium sp.]|uniref:WecB/TagA/CpsF family glycosyltransferase n=1 Tax=Phenylobacterium sp. TaxID=1871053 RepID=UPI0035AEF21E
MNAERPPRVRLLGAEVDLVTPQMVLATVAARVAAGAPAVIANHNAHSLHLYRKSAKVRAFFEMADLIEVDSTPVIAWGRLMGLPLSRAHRCTYLDWRDAFWGMVQAKGWRVFYLGGAPGVAERAAARLAAEWPGVSIACRDGYFDRATGGADNRAVVDAINAFRPDIIFVGMGMPLQEEWIAANRAAIPRGVMFSIGAAFDYEAGVQTAAPRWMGRLGLEWLFRLASQPRRLAYRYLIEPWSLAPAAWDDLRGLWPARARPVLDVAQRPRG